MRLRWKIGIGFVVAFLAIAFVMHPPLTSQDWAAWVQAFGAILAIVGAWAIAMHQRADERRVRAAEKAKGDALAAEICFELAKDACVVMQNVAQKFEVHPNGGSLHIGHERIEDVQFSLRTLARKDIPPGLYAPLLRLQRELAYTLTAVRQQNGFSATINAEVLRKAKSRVTNALVSRDAIKQIAHGYHGVIS